VICEGTMKADADVFVVTYLGHPPAESRTATLNTFPNADFLGDGVLTDPLELVRGYFLLRLHLINYHIDLLVGCLIGLALLWFVFGLGQGRVEAWERSVTHNEDLDLMQLDSQTTLYDMSSDERRHWGPAVLMFSEVALDDAFTFAKLKHTIAGALAQVRASHQTVAMIVFIGNFVTASKCNSLETYVAAFEKLGEHLAPRTRDEGNPLVDSSCRLVFIPGPSDMTPSREILPRPGLIRPIREALFVRSALTPNQVHFASNPTRYVFPLHWPLSLSLSLFFF